jgi:hypothetical protein
MMSVISLNESIAIPLHSNVKFNMGDGRNI